MKKLIISLAFAVAAASTVSAQNLLVDNPDNEAYLGARIGVDITSTPATAGYFRNGAGFSAGAIYNIPMWQNLYFEPGLSFFYDTFNEDITVPTDDENIQALLPHSYRNFGFRIPLIAGYRFDFTDMVSIAIFTGPQINFSLYAHDHYGKVKSGLLTEETTDLEEGSLFGHRGFKHWDLQWAFGASVAYDNYIFSVQGGVGMTPVFKDAFTKLRRNTLTISVGYNF